MISARTLLAVAYAEAGRKTEAAREAQEAMRIHPEISAEANPFVAAYKDATTRKRYAGLLRSAGLNK